MLRQLRAALALATCLSLAACASEQAPPPQPEPEPVAAEEPIDGPGEGPGAGPIDEPVQPDPALPEPPPRRSGDRSIAVRADDSPTKRVLFLNDFGRPHAKKVVALLKQDASFDAERFTVDDARGRRITVECTYRGKNLRSSVSSACDAAGVPHHFREAELPKHLEVYRTKR